MQSETTSDYNQSEPRYQEAPKYHAYYPNLRWIIPEERFEVVTIGARDIEDPVERLFLSLASKWRQETRGRSTTLHMTMNDNYLDIMSMGPSVIRYILKELEQRPNHWFVALKHLAKALEGKDVNPVPPEERGDVLKSREAWLRWGRQKGLL